FVVAGSGALIWWLGGVSRPTILDMNAPTPPPAVELIDSATDRQALRRFCRPVAEFQDHMLQANRAMMNQIEKAFSSLIVVLITVGSFLGFVFGFIYLTMRRVRA